jgi:Tfp pilus assembly protein PilF
MTWRSTPLRVAWLSVVLATVGCGMTRNRGTELAARPAPAVERAVRPAKDLPPGQAAKLCLNVAAELEKNGYETEAIEQYEKAEKLDPRSVKVAHRLAVLYDRQGNIVRAQAEYRRTLETSPKDADLINDMGYFCYERGNWTEAERWLRKALAVDPKHARAHVNLGMALAQQGKVDEALAAFAAVVSPAEAQANLGMILAQRGQVEEAKQAFRKSLDSEPDSKVVRAALTALEKPDAISKAVLPATTRVSAH